MPHNLISDMPEWIKEMPNVLANPQPREQTWEDQQGTYVGFSLCLHIYEYAVGFCGSFGQFGIIGNFSALINSDFYGILTDKNVDTAFGNFYNIVGYVIDTKLPVKTKICSPKIVSHRLKSSHKTKLKLYKKPLTKPITGNINT